MIVHDSNLKKVGKGYECINDGIAESYYLDGFLHREGDLPAYKDINGTKMYYWHGKKHRTKGPAQTSPNTLGRYFLEGNEILGQDLDDFLKLIKMDILCVPLFINHNVLSCVAKERLKEITS